MISKGEAKFYDHHYFDRWSKIQASTMDPIIIPSGLLDIRRYGIPFPAVPCYLALETRNHPPKRGRSGMWLYIIEKPAAGDANLEMPVPQPTDLPHIGTVKYFVAISREGRQMDIEDDEFNDRIGCLEGLPIIQPVSLTSFIYSPFLTLAHFRSLRSSLYASALHTLQPAHLPPSMGSL